MTEIKNNLVFASVENIAPQFNVLIQMTDTASYPKQQKFFDVGRAAESLKLCSDAPDA